MKENKPKEITAGKAAMVRALAAGQRWLDKAVAKRKKREAEDLKRSTLRF